MYEYEQKGKRIAVFGDHEDKTLVQISAVAADERCVAAALMADGHLGYGMPIGGVAAYDNAISPEGVGFDIACGNMAVRTALSYEDVQDELPQIMDQIFKEIPFGVGQANGQWADHEVFEHPNWNSLTKVERAELRNTARQQLGSVGSGNHYVDILLDEHSRVWVGVHFGSRGLGHKLATKFIKAIKGKAGGDMMEPPSVISLDTELGTDYWAAMELAGAYAYAGRDCVVEHVVKGILSTHTDYEVHNHHNYAWKEQQIVDDEAVEVVVVRKGATPAFPEQEGFVGGSMGDDAVILQGGVAGDERTQIAALFSTVHGAGRTMSRGQAKKTIKREEMRDWIQRRGVELRGAGLDESPQAYRRLEVVLNEQGDTVWTQHVLRPIGVAMAGPKDWDPFGD